MARRLEGRAVLITGAGPGTGEAIAHRFAAEGARLVITARSSSAGDACARAIRSAGGEATYHAASLRDRHAVDALVQRSIKRLGGLDVVVHNAEATSYDPLSEMNDDALDRVLDVNLKACFFLARAAYAALAASGRGRLLITSSVNGPRVAMPNMAHYAASKAGVNGFIRSAALEWAGRGITVNGVEPGHIVDTAPMTALIARFGRQALTRKIPAQRLGKPEEVAHAMLFLASDEAAYITGQTLVVDGGATLPESPASLEPSTAYAPTAPAEALASAQTQAQAPETTRDLDVLDDLRQRIAEASRRTAPIDIEPLRAVRGPAADAREGPIA